MWHTGNGRRADARDGDGKNSRAADTDGRQVIRERREVERKRRFVISVVKHFDIQLTLPLGMYRIAIFKIQPEPDSTGYQTNYPAGTGYLDTCWIIANFLVYFVVRIKNVLFHVFVFSFVCSHTA